MPVVSTCSVTSSFRLFGVPDKLLDQCMIQVQGLVVDSLLSLLNLVCRGKGDGPQVFLFSIVSKDGSHVSEGFFVSWKCHLYSFQCGYGLLRHIKEKL